MLIANPIYDVVFKECVSNGNWGCFNPLDLYNFDKIMKKVKITIASQEQLLFMKSILPIFLDKILGHPEALVTDKTNISDFSGFSVEDSVGKGIKPGHYLFKYMVSKGNKKNFKEIIFECKAIHYQKWIIRKCKRFFGVDITDCYNKPLPEVLHYIIKNMSKQKINEIGL